MSRLKVLIVEDESITALQLKNKVISWDFDVVEIVASGEEAVEKALDLKPDIILMDIVLRGHLNGVDAAKKIKETLDIPVIYLTAYVDQDTMNKAMSTEPHNYILKPFDDNELRFALEMAVYRHEMEAKLKTTQDYLKLITENMVDNVGQVDENGIFLYTSPAIKKMLGYEPADVIGKSIFEFIHPDDLEGTYKLFAKCIKNQKPVTVRNRFLNVSGEYIWIETLGNPIFDVDGNLKGAVFSSREINHQKEIEEELKSALDYSRNLIEASLDPMVTISESGKIMDVNKATEESTGLSRQELIGSDFSQYFTNPEKAMRGYQKTLFYGSLKDYPLTMRHASGRTMDVLYNASVYRDRDGEVQGVFAAARNITILKKANRALKLSERHFRSLIENALDVILVLNEQGDITYVSPSAERVFGFKVHEILGFNIFDFIHHQDTPLASMALSEQIKESGSNVEFEVRYQHEDGTWCICQMVAQNLLRDPAVRGIVINARDITPRKVAERARNDLEEMYRTFLMASQDGVLASDLDGNITHVSEKAILMLGWEKTHDFSKESFFDIISLSEHDLLDKNMNDVIKDGFVHNIEHTVIKKDGTTFIAELSMGLSKDSQETPKGYIATIRDISYRKEMEEQIKSSLKEKEFLLKEIHHRVKNNMQVISSLIGLQSQQAKDKEVKCMFKDSKNRIKSMALIHENLYRSENMENINILEYVETLVEGLKNSYSNNSIDINVQVVDVLLNIDQAVSCGLIINELVSNSLKYAFNQKNNSNYEIINSEITNTGQIDISILSNGNNILMKIKDNGVGFPEDLDYKNAESLGLKIVDILVSQLDGVIELNGSQGTEFTIIFKNVSVTDT
jgi:PAS domain S-box-containing protein